MKARLFHSFCAAIVFVSGAAASTLTGSISGTCGFYQGTLANVVFSQSFSGDGTFCTGFMAGGSFTNSGTLQVGDVFALSHNTIEASAPTGYGVFVNFKSTFQVQQDYLLTPPVPSTTASGTVTSFIGGIGGTDDGSGLGSCYEHSGISLLGYSTPGSRISSVLNLNVPILVTETTSATCSDYGPVGHGFGDDGMQEVYAGPFLLYDANGKLLGQASLSAVPEPSTLLLLAPVCLVAGLWRVRRVARGR